MDKKLWRENGKENFLECVWLSEEEGNKWWGSSVFFPDPPKSFLPKLEKNLKGENDAI